METLNARQIIRYSQR